MSAGIKKQSARKDPSRVTKRGERFHADFGFIRASDADYNRPSKLTDRVVLSYNGYNSYLAISDEVSRHVWIFLTPSKEPPIDIMRTFLARFGNPEGGLILSLIHI